MLAGEYSLLEFYKRRILRILRALSGIVFWKLQTGPEITPAEAALLFVVALGVAWVSTRWIEAPFRARGFRALAPARMRSTSRCSS